MSSVEPIGQQPYGCSLVEGAGWFLSGRLRRASAGPPPYELYEVRPVTVFSVGTDEPFGGTCFVKPLYCDQGKGRNRYCRANDLKSGQMFFSDQPG